MTDHPEFPTGSHFADSWPNGKSKHPAGPFLREHQPYKVNLAILDNLSDPEFLMEMMRIRFAHVTSSANLPILVATPHNGELVLRPTGELINSGHPPFGGEMGMGITPGRGINQRSVSMFDASFSYTPDYLDLMQRVAQPWHPGSSTRDSHFLIGRPKSDQDEYLKQREKIETDRNNTFNSLSVDDQNLITNPFPIVWGLTSISMPRGVVQSSVAGECSFTSVPLPENTYAFVQDTDIPRTEQEFRRLKIKAKIMPFSYLYAVQTIKKSYSPDRVGGVWWTPGTLDDDTVVPSKIEPVAKDLAEYVASLSTTH